MPESDIPIREANLDDVIGIVYVQATTWIDAYPNSENGISEADIRSIDFHGKVRDWQHMIQSPNYRVWVASKDDEIIAVIAARADESSKEIYEQCVLPDYQRQGIGTRLLNEALAWLGEDYPISLRIISYNQVGVAFYKKFGFRISELGEVDFLRLPTGKNIPTLEMRKTGKLEPAPMPEQPATATAPEPSVETLPVDTATEAKPSPRADSRVSRAKLAKLSKLRPSTIKFYTEIGLLPFEQAEKRLARRYNAEQTLARLKEIQELRKQGFSIKDIANRLK